MPFIISSFSFADDKKDDIDNFQAIDESFDHEIYIRISLRLNKIRNFRSSEFINDFIWWMLNSRLWVIKGGLQCQ